MKPWLLPVVIAFVGLGLLVTGTEVGKRIERSENMRCKIEGHRGTEVVLLPADHAHYAKVICKECDFFLKWLGKDEYETLFEPMENGLSAAAKRMERCIDEAERIFVCPEEVSGEFRRGQTIAIAFKLFDAEAK